MSPDVGKEVEEKTGTNGVEETSSTSPNATSLPGQPTDAQVIHLTNLYVENISVYSYIVSKGQIFLSTL